MNNKIEPKTLPGFMELLPNDQVVFNKMKDSIKESYENFGFLPLDTPIIELSEILLAKAGGETEKQIYRFIKGDNDLALRFDLTVPLAKFIAANYANLSFPFKRYQIGKVYRGERPQKGRFREFYQCDIDIIGDNELSIINDAEIPSIIYTTFLKLGFNNFTICINNRKILNGLFESLELTETSVDIMRIIDKFDKIGEEAVKGELQNLGVPNEKISDILKFILINEGTNEEKIKALENMPFKSELYCEGIKELREVSQYIKAFGVPDEFFKIDLKIARGLDYYTGTVYETFLNDYRNFGSVCSGGRYDNLAEYYTDKKLPGVGVSIGLTRLFSQLIESKAIEDKKRTISDVLVVSADEEIYECMEVATILRKNGINTELYSNNKKMKAKMKYADRSKIPFLLIIGEEERQTKKYTLKNMNTGEQEKLEINEIVKKIKH